MFGVNVTDLDVVSWNDVGVLDMDGVVHVWLSSLQRVSLELFLVLINLVRSGMKTKSQRSRAGRPSMRKLASRQMISASAELCETDVCFLHIQLVGTNV